MSLTSGIWLMASLSCFPFFQWHIVALQCCISFCYTAKRINQIYASISYPLDFLPLSPHRAWSRVPRAMQEVPTGHLFYRQQQQCVYANPNLPIHPTSSSYLGSHTLVLYASVSTFALQISLSVPSCYILSFKTQTGTESRMPCSETHPLHISVAFCL